MNPLEVIKDELQYWLDTNERSQMSSGLVPSDNTHVYPPSWPTRGVLKLWIAGLSSFSIKRTEDELPSISKNILLWLPRRKRWAMAFLRQDDMFYVGDDGAYILKEDGHTFWMELPHNPEVEE